MGVLGAAIWLAGINTLKHGGKLSFDLTVASPEMERFLASADYEFECTRIVGRKFADVADHAAVAMLLPSVWIFPPYVLLMILLGGGQEELEWRGYIVDPLEARLGAWLGHLVLGVIWAFWHLPLFFIPGTSQTFMPFAGFVLLTTGIPGSSPGCARLPEDIPGPG